MPTHSRSHMDTLTGIANVLYDHEDVLECWVDGAYPPIDDLPQRMEDVRMAQEELKLVRATNSFMDWLRAEKPAVLQVLRAEYRLREGAA